MRPGTPAQSSLRPQTHWNESDAGLAIGPRPDVKWLECRQSGGEALFAARMLRTWAQGR